MSESIEVPIGDETYRMSPITLADLAKFENQIKSERLRIALDVLPPSTDRAEIVAEILNANVDVTEALTSMSGISYLLWLSIVHMQSDVKLDAFREKLKLEDLRILQTLIDKLAFGDSPRAEEDNNNPPAESTAPAST